MSGELSKCDGLSVRPQAESRAPGPRRCPLATESPARVSELQPGMAVSLLSLRLPAGWGALRGCLQRARSGRWLSAARGCGSLRGAGGRVGCINSVPGPGWERLGGEPASPLGGGCLPLVEVRLLSCDWVGLTDQNNLQQGFSVHPRPPSAAGRLPQGGTLAGSEGVTTRGDRGRGGNVTPRLKRWVFLSSSLALALGERDSDVARTSEAPRDPELCEIS